ncbi:MAG: GWxTD domain-containing protein, partial [Gemmatimonadota bacterium]|nr:GWxTD domain-containing protein [Gemmatimonadota bacterium]
MKRLGSILVAFVLVGGCGPALEGPTLDLSSVNPAPETYAREDLRHLQYLLTDAEASAYLMMADTDREGWMRAYWASLDPTPTTPENERHDAHYRRLAYAMDRFAIDDPPGWDRRGELLIRYGPPDQRDRRSGDVVEGLGLVPPAEVWIYFQLSHAFQLEDITLKDNFQDSFERQGSGRVDLQGNIAAMQDVGSSEGRRSSFGRQEIDAYDVEAEMRQRTLKSMMQRGQTALR